MNFDFNGGIMFDNNRNNSRILSELDISIIKSEILNLRTDFKEFVDYLNDLHELLSRDETMNSLFDSGNFGQEIKTKLLDLKNIINEYYNTIFVGDTSLFVQTADYCDRQLSLLNKGF